MARILYFARETLISLRRNLMMTVAGILTIGVSMSLLGSALLLSSLVDNGVSKIRTQIEFEVFMNIEVTPSELAALDEQMATAKADGVISSFDFLDEAEAFARAEELFSDRPEVLSGMKVGDFPQSYVATLADAGFASEARAMFDGRPGVDRLISPDKTAAGIKSVSNFIEMALLVMVIVLGAAALFLVVNTIRLATYARRREIEVMKLVGASNWFVQVPFMAEGLTQGILGAGFAVGVVYFLKGVLVRAIDSVDKGVVKTFEMTSADAFSAGLFVLVLGALIGLIGSLLGLRRFLDV